MWTTGIAPLCSFGFVIDAIVFDQVMPQFELCCIVFAWQLSSLSELVGVTNPKQSLYFCCCFCQLALLFTLSFFRARHLATQFLAFSCLFFLIFFCLDKDRFGSLLWIMDLCTHFILMFAVIFIFTLTTELQKSLSLSFSGCEYRERTWTRFQWICQMFINKHTRNNSECCFI